jgi:hypothetical protein
MIKVQINQLIYNKRSTFIKKNRGIRGGHQRQVYCITIYNILNCKQLPILIY